MRPQEPGVDRHVVNALLCLLLYDLQHQFAGYVRGTLACDNLIDRHSADRDRRIGDEARAYFADIAARA